MESAVIVAHKMTLEWSQMGDQARGLSKSSPPAVTSVPQIYDCNSCEWVGTDVDVKFSRDDDCDWLMKYLCPECGHAFTVIDRPSHLDDRAYQ